MRKSSMLSLTLLVLVGVAPLLSACNTTKGAGEDITAAGQAVKSSAQRNTP